MEIVKVTSSSNSLLKRIRLLKRRSGREELDCFLIEGGKLFDEAITHGIEIVDVVVNQEFLDNELSSLRTGTLSKATLVDDKLFSGLATTDSPQGLLAVAQRRTWTPDALFANRESSQLVVIADRIQDPGNLGTMMRTSLALGASGVIITCGSADPFNPKVVRAAAGALFALPFFEAENTQAAMELCRKNGLHLFAFAADGLKNLADVDLKQPSALMFGNEANGLDAQSLRSADTTVAIPMVDASESLNVSVSHAIVLYEAMAQRRR